MPPDCHRNIHIFIIDHIPLRKETSFASEWNPPWQLPDAQLEKERKEKETTNIIIIIPRQQQLQKKRKEKRERNKPQKKGKEGGNGFASDGTK